METPRKKRCNAISCRPANSRANTKETNRNVNVKIKIAVVARIWLAGIVAYGVSQMLNVYLFDRLKNTVGKDVALRGAIAAVLSQIIDTLLFVTIAFYGVFPITELLFGQMLAKVVLSMIMVPLLITFFVSYGHKLDGTDPKVGNTHDH